ncbi:MAG TPA: TonB family protein [Pyrinomonadaceae bacterium]|jgi:TonB family protein|nr:TonB family protein [Pyrinomonadaceae bacterium]
MPPALGAILFSVILSIFCFGQAHAQQVRLSSEEAEELVIEKPEPLYPAIAKAARAEGIVKVEVAISELGMVTSAKAISGHPLLQIAALDAVKRRKYKAHMVGDKPVPFITDVYIRFPPGTITSAQKQDYERQEELARQYFKEGDKCRNLVRGQKWEEAEEPCRVTVQIADQLSDNRSLERMGAYEMFGHVLRGQKRYQEAIEYYNRALDAVRSRLTEKDAELGRLYGDIAITHHLLRDLDKARELYRKAELIYQLAHDSIGDGDSDEWVVRTKQEYMKALKKLLEYHLIAAEDAGVASEVEEIRKLMKSLH